VTGLGLVTPLGLDVASTWDGLVKGRSGIGPITQFDASAFDVRFAGEIKGFDASLHVEKKELKKMDRFIQIALAASAEAIADSGLEWTDPLRERTGALIGVGIGGLQGIETQDGVLRERGPGRITPFFIPQVITNMAAGNLTIKYGFRGPNYSVTSACASGVHSIGDATEYIRRGICDVMIAGGSEAAVTPLGIGGFAALKALSTRNDNPSKASRPFDKDRDGFVLSEASGIMVLEDLEHAIKRGARIYAEVTGYGVSSDAHHMTSPHPEGAGAAQAMRGALADARLNPGDVAYINAHGTSTPVGDELESRAIKAVFGQAAKSLWVSSTKSMTGHALGAAGAIESVFTTLALAKGVVPPTINLDSPSEGCDLDYVPHQSRERRMSHVMNNSFGFGGTNACLIFSQVGEG
jgi:3-oxoacyl-[acyl-carrier-protein] synthase II